LRDAVLPGVTILTLDFNVTELSAGTVVLPAAALREIRGCFRFDEAA
jgi:hypothetical protein